MSNQLRQTHADITAHLQKYGILTGVKVKVWSGTFTPKAGEIPDQATVGVVRGISKQGHIVLIENDDLAGFSKVRSKAVSYLKNKCYPFPLFSGAFFTVLSDVPEISRFLNEEIIPEFNATMETFFQKYEGLKAERCRLFNEIYPTITGYLDSKFPSESGLRAKFGITHCMVNWASPEKNQVAQQEIDNFQQQTVNFMNDLALDIRRTALDACLAFKKALSTKSGQVNDGAIEKFKNMLTRIKNHNILQDEKLEDLVNRIQTSVFQVNNWTTEEDLKGRIKGHLDEVIQLAEAEGEVAAVSSNFIRQISGEELEEVEEVGEDTIVRLIESNEPEAVSVDIEVERVPSAEPIPTLAGAIPAVSIGEQPQATPEEAHQAA